MPRRLTLAAMLVFTPLQAADAQPAPQPAIRWEVENGFRYFKSANDYRNIVRIYRGLQATSPLPSALQLERALEKATAVDNGFNGITGADRRLGWAASVYLNTCGRQKDHTHRSCELADGESYLQPKATSVILGVDGVSGQCQWSIDGTPAGSAACSGNDAAAKPLAAKVSYNDTHHITVTLPDGARTLSTDIVVRDILIVSFGDSFSAGEGNPEKPVAWSNTFSDYGRSSRHGTFPQIVDNFPVRLGGAEFWGDNAANWTNSQCHRSLYSGHTKAALQYALEHPHGTVTLLNYSCTGAEVFEGILNAWWARDVAQQHWDDAPQLVKALRDLCDDQSAYMQTDWSKGDRNDKHFNDKIADIAKCGKLIRSIDVLLLSIGGNDIGFANMIANTSINVPASGPLKGGRPWAYGIWRAASGPQTFAAGRAKARALLPGHYRELARQLQAYLSVDAGKVILSAYPDVSTDEHGKTCQTRTTGMDVHAIFGTNNPAASDQAEAFTDFLHTFMKTQAARLGWQFADQHVADAKADNNFRGHGLCANGAPPDSPVDPTVTTRFPRPTLPGSPPFVWTPFYPTDYPPYSPRNRWLVTPNDSYLATNYLDSHLGLDDPVQPVYAATLSGSFHPNALGQAALADSVLVSMRTVLAAPH